MIVSVVAGVAGSSDMPLPEKAFNDPLVLSHAVATSK